MSEERLLREQTRITKIADEPVFASEPFIVMLRVRLPLDA